ncbi:MAG: DUF4258 domain-containing protein [Flavobacteriales bacterium]|nr:DUF4258 domain-containing protein [Flavobacteriales bacterium]
MKKPIEYPKVIYRWEKKRDRMVASLKTRVAEFTFKCTHHFEQRAAKRGLSIEKMLKVIEYGEAIFKQGLIFYTVTKRSFPAYANARDIEYLNNWVVVVGDHGEVVTCYRSDNGIRYLNRKRGDRVR